MWEELQDLALEGALASALVGALAAPLSPALISPAHDELHVWGPFTVDLLCWGLNTYLPSGASGSAAVFQVPDLRYDLQARTTYLVMNSEIPGT